MTDSRPPFAPREPVHTPLELPANLKATPFRGTDLSVLVQNVLPGLYERHRHDQAQLCLTFDPAAGAFRRYITDQRSEDLPFAGRALCCIRPNVPHDCRWEREARLIAIYLESTFLARQDPSRVQAVFDRKSFPEATHDPVIWQAALAAMDVQA